MSDALLFDQWIQRISSDIEFQGAPNSASSHWKRYFHFDTRLQLSDINDKWRKRLMSPEYVRQHPFYPFLKREIIKKHFGNVSIQNFKGEIRHVRAKLRKKPTRPICYAAHRDALIYAWYAFKLNQLLEIQIEQVNLSESIIAYRSLDQRCNIHFAKEAFDFVRDKQECVALAFDVKSFFDTLDHEVIRRSWCRLLGVDRLPADHFTVYKSMTTFRYVELETLERELGEKELEASQQHGRYVNPADFRKRIVPLIKTNATRGIPQGAPLSAVLSNLYMLEADKALAAFAKDYGGYYRRYCDDLLLIVPPDKVTEAYGIMRETMNALELRINDDKTEVCYFKPAGTALSCCDQDGEKTALQYLGLEFDGREIRLRPASLARYHHRLRRNVRQAAKMAFGRRSYCEGKILKRTLYEKFSSLGSRNFITYAHKAYRITNSSAIKKQYNRSVALVNQCVAAETARHQARAKVKPAVQPAP